MTATDPLGELLSGMGRASDLTIGPGQPIALTPAELHEMERDADILRLAVSGLTYPEIARRLDLPMPQVVTRIAGMLKSHPLLSEEHIGGYLAHQLDLLAVGIQSALDDMAAEDVGDYKYDKLAAQRRDSGRMALVKLMLHQAAILGLLRQRIDVNRREQINITVVRSEDFDAL